MKSSGSGCLRALVQLFLAGNIRYVHLAQIAELERPQGYFAAGVGAPVQVVGKVKARLARPRRLELREDPAQRGLPQPAHRARGQLHAVLATPEDIRASMNGRVDVNRTIALFGLLDHNDGVGAGRQRSGQDAASERHDDASQGGINERCVGAVATGAGDERQREEHESCADDAKAQRFEREERRQVWKSGPTLAVQLPLGHRHQRRVQQRDHGEAVGDHREREMQLELRGLRVRAARREPGKERRQRRRDGRRPEHERLHPLQAGEQALDPVERDAEEHHHRQRLRETESELSGKNAVVEQPAVQGERQQDRRPFPAAQSCGRLTTPAGIPEVPREPDVHGRDDCVNYNVGHRFSLSPEASIPVLDTLTSRFARIVKHLRGEARLTEANIQEALREVRVALLEADVALPVVKHFIDSVRAAALGEDVVGSLTPGQALVGVVHRELTALMGEANAGLDLATQPPAVILMAGLQGSGKTTTVGKLARLLQKRGRAPLLVAVDVYRPAAMDQLETLGQQLELPVFVRRGETDVLKIAHEALEFARANQRNTLIFDTAGRRQIDEPLVQELVRLRDLVRAQEILLVLDAATGQEAVNVAAHFDQTLQVTGAILTKLDGDARGGASLSLKAITGKPIKFIGLGEKLEDFEPFHPERMASRILGMGDVVSLVERAAEAVDIDEAKKLEEKMRKGQFSLEDFLDQLRQMKKIGSLESIVSMLPGGSEMLQNTNMSKQEKEFRRMEGIICAMTLQERRTPQILNAKRRIRIAKGSGTSVQEVNQLLKQYAQARKMMKSFSGGVLGKKMGKLKLPLFQ